MPSSLSSLSPAKSDSEKAVENAQKHVRQHDEHIKNRSCSPDHRVLREVANWDLRAPFDFLESRVHAGLERAGLRSESSLSRSPSEV